MYKREDVLAEALLKNENECERWETYLQENETAIENMGKFSKRLTVECMVPLGKKAFMPGHLIHTNEVLVAHYQGYFSKCTTSKANEICELRIKMARQHLKNLEVESDLWRNKLNKPYSEGVIPSGDEREIIEEFNEETEKLWKEKHRISVRLAKQKEREERLALHAAEKAKENTTKEKTDDEVIDMLTEAELMEELEQELNSLELDEINDDTIRRLMSGEMKLPQEKKRIAHDCKDIEMGPTNKIRNIIKKTAIENVEQINTNNNIQQNPEIINVINDDVEEIGDENLLEEVKIIKEQAKFLNAEDQIGFFDYQIQIVRQKLQRLSLRTQKELNEKIHLLDVLEHLEELLEQAEESIGTLELDEHDQNDDVDENESGEMWKIEESTQKTEQKVIADVTPKNKTHNESKGYQKRRISFALEDQTLVFKKNEAVTQMLPPNPEKPQRDIVKLDKDTEEQEKFQIEDKKSVSKLDLIQSKVQKNLEFVSEYQSKQDFDLVEQILQSSTVEINTLHINFQHSQQEGYQIDNQEFSEIPGSPADIYKFYVRSQQSSESLNQPSVLFINTYEGEDQVRVPTLKEADRHSAFLDPKSEFSNPFQTKSILKNKSAVDKENHYKGLNRESSNEKKKSNKKSNVEADDCLSAYYKVMNDVVEKNIREPDPLPDVKFIDANAPKKRVSRFKQMRKGKENT